ncbi:MAG: tRNA-intron lyase [Nitrospiraceae bacterium]|nr:tRNA-intron lyase [Nitrospiraceae bacterium]
MEPKHNKKKESNHYNQDNNLIQIQSNQESHDQGTLPNNSKSNTKSALKSESKSNMKSNINNKKIKVILQSYDFIGENSDRSRLLLRKNYGTQNELGNIILSPYEALFLLEQGKIEIYTPSNKILTFSQIIKKFNRKIKDFMIQYIVFKDLRKKGYTLKTALKFGANFRVYEKSKSPDEVHAKWILYVTKETESIKWHEFVAKNRVAHSTRKRVLIAIVDEELNVIYYEIKWVKV